MWKECGDDRELLSPDVFHWPRGWDERIVHRPEVDSMHRRCANDAESGQVEAHEDAWREDDAKQFLAAVQRLLTDDADHRAELDRELQRRGVAPLGEALLIARSNAGVDHLKQLRPSYLESVELTTTSAQVVREVLRNETVQEAISSQDQKLAASSTI